MRFWLEIAYLYGCICRACAEWGVNLLPEYRNWSDILICTGRFAYSSSNLQRRSWSFRGVHWRSPHVKASFERSFYTVENRPKICFFGWQRGQNVKKCYRDPQKACPFSNFNRLLFTSLFDGEGCKRHLREFRTSWLCLASPQHIVIIIIIIMTSLLLLHNKQGLTNPRLQK